MSYNVNNIIPINTFISPSGIAFANFSSAVLFAPESELPSGFATDTHRTYNSLTGITDDGFDATDQTYLAASRWLGGIPASRELIIYGVDSADADWATTLNKARNQIWWFWSFFTSTVYADATDVEAIATWCNDNESYFVNCQTGSSATDIRDPSNTSNIARTLTANGVRYSTTFTHATDPYAGIALAKWFAAVNYQGDRTTITGEYKVLSGVTAESLTEPAYNSMLNASTKAAFYSHIDLQGSIDAGRVINSVSHSSFGEFMDDVINLAAFVNALKVGLFNTIANQTTKLGQAPVDQSVLIGNARQTCQQYITNRYLGPRTYIDPDDGIEKTTAGFEILTQPEEILNLAAPNRAAREAAPLRIRIFRLGAIHTAPVDVNVF